VKKAHPLIDYRGKRENWLRKFCETFSIAAPVESEGGKNEAKEPNCMIYSPSKTEAYDACSLRGQLMYTDHWELREANNGTVGKISGAAFAKGAEAIHNKTSNGVDIAHTLFDRTVSHYVTHGVSFSMDLAKAKAVLLKTLERYHAADPLKGWEIQATELSLKDYGNCRLDIVGRDPEGYQSIADNKYKRTLSADYLNKNVADYRDSWQFQHYPWSYNSWIDHVSGGELKYKVERMWLILVIAEPFKVLQYPFFVNEKLQRRWAASAQQKWVDIHAYETGNRQVTMATVHRDNYADCPMKEACLEMDLDPALMQFKYTKVPRLPDETI